MSDPVGGGGPPKWVPDPRQQVHAEDARNGSRPDVERYAVPGLADQPGMQGIGAQAPESGQADEPVAPGPGALLAGERAAQGLGVGDVARQLKLSARQVEALERDDYDAFAGMVFVRGFLRNYAKLLDVDPEPLVAMTYDASAEALPLTSPPIAEEVVAARTAGPRRGWLLGAVVLIALVVAAIFEGRQREAPRGVFEPLPAPVPASPPHAESPAQQRDAMSSALDPAAPAPAAESPQHAESPPPGAGAPGADEPATAVVAAPAAGAAPEEAAPAPVEPVAAVSPAAPAAAGEKQLKLAFDGASWVEVKDSAGAVIFSQLNDAGTEQIVRGRAPLSLVIGNAHSVRLSYGDRPVDLGPHTNVDVARLVLE
jgi:cytoskeleton protein RodZ